MKMTKEIEEFINLTITEHMGKSYADWKKKLLQNIVMRYLAVGQKQRNSFIG